VFEVEGNTTPFPLSQMLYSAAEYELSVSVSSDSATGELSVTDAKIIVLAADSSEQELGTSLDDGFIFTNSYWRSTTGTQEDPVALRVSKTTEGEFADLSLLFDFDIILTPAAFTAEDATFALGKIYDADGNQLGSDIEFVNNSDGRQQHIQMGHGHKLVFESLVIGTGFEVVERAVQDFRASLSLVVNGQTVGASSDAEYETELSTGVHLIGQDRNYAAFTNVHRGIPVPTGLLLGGSAPIACFAACAAFAVPLCITKKYKRISKNDSASYTP
jgi:hypothetical protein